MEITSELKGQGIYLGGETLQCMITFKNLSHQSKVENLAWASAQIQSLCQLVDNSSRRKFSESGEGGSSNSLVGKFGGVASHQFVTSLQPGSLVLFNNRLVFAKAPATIFGTLEKNLPLSYLRLFK